MGIEPRWLNTFLGHCTNWSTPGLAYKIFGQRSIELDEINIIPTAIATHYLSI